MNLREAAATFRGHRVPRMRIIEHRRWWFLLSGGVLLLSLVGLLWRGLNYSIDFEGGAQLTYENRAGVTVEDVRGVLAQEPWGREDAEVQLVGADQISVRTASLNDLTDRERTALIDALAEQAGIAPGEVNRQDVGPTWGAEISRKALQGLIVVLLAITLYITFRFEWKMAISSQVAMVHDVAITAGIYALVGREVTPATVIAILTILGFSLYDTVVIFDKIKENTESPALLAKDTYADVANASLNAVFMRSVNTSLVVVLPILSLLLFGGETLKDFAFAMLVGTITGAYSSIFVAAPLLVVLKEREPKHAQHRRDIERAASRPRLVRDEEDVEAETEIEEERAAAAMGAARATGRTVGTATSPPRPRSKRKPPAKRKRR